VPTVLPSLVVKGRLGLPPTGRLRGMVVRRMSVLDDSDCSRTHAASQHGTTRPTFRWLLLHSLCLCGRCMLEMLEWSLAAAMTAKKLTKQ